jgi:hypothetical protein
MLQRAVAYSTLLWMVGTLVLSLVLLALYKPVTSGLRGLVAPQG